MIRILFYFLFVLSISVTSHSQTKLKSKLIASCGEGGRCTGSSYCSACTNCSRCKHCSNGGSCGVCSGGSTSSTVTSYPRSKSKRRSSSASSNSNHSSANSTNNNGTSSENDEIVYDSVLMVKTTTLNVRKGPGKEFPIILVLDKGDFVRCVETTDGDWIKVEAVSSGVIGYVYKRNLQ